ncbi:MAG: class II aldolase/adducin family protein [Gammaproteobacteria bacterium]|nr:class II aldolase/adducin family protein [Gammaproteobacteria bacterium]
MQHLQLRKEIIHTARSFMPLGLGVGTAGNVSGRVRDGFLITPSGVAYGRLRPAHLVLMAGSGAVRGGALKPSSEWRFHRDIYAARPEVRAIVHVHSPFATAIACTRRGIPAFHYMVAVAGGDSIRCAPYATFGTQALSSRAVRALRQRSSCLLANHGQIALGEDLPSALKVALEVEELAKQYWLANLFAKPVTLGRREMRKIVGKFRNYGRQGV